MKNILKSIEIQIFLVFFITTTFLSITTRINGEYGIMNNGEIFIILTTILSGMAYATVYAEYDHSKIIYKHLGRAIVRLILLFFLPIILVIQTSDFTNLYLGLLGLTVFYFFFEFFYNNKRDHPPFYVGTVAWNDRTVRWINHNSSFMMLIYPGWYIAFKVILFVVSLVLTIKYWV